MSKQRESELTELRLQSQIDECAGELVELGDRIIDKLGPAIDKVEPSQLRNALAVTSSAPHPAVVKSFVRYQIGRQTTAKAWKETGLGENLISAIDGDIPRMAEKAAVVVKEEAARDLEKQGAGGTNVDVVDLQMRMLRLLLGFMNRRFVYEADRRKEKKQEKK